MLSVIGSLADRPAGDPGLRNVGELVGQQLTSGLRRRLILATAEEDVIPGGDSLGTQQASRSGSGRAEVKPDSAQVHPEGAFEPMS